MMNTDPNLNQTNTPNTQNTPSNSTSNPSYQSEYHWQGSSYSYHPQQSAPYYASISKPVKTPEQKKKSRKAGKIVAAIAAVMFLSAPDENIPPVKAAPQSTIAVSAADIVPVISFVFKTLSMTVSSLCICKHYST